MTSCRSDSSPLQDKIKMLTRHFEEEMRKLSSSHQHELEQMRKAHAAELQNLNENFQTYLSLLNSGHELRIADLENEIAYLKEVNQAQRKMIEDRGYNKALEDKMNSGRED